jgi:DNA processing protein
VPNDAHTCSMLRLCLTPGLGPVRITRAIDVLGSPDAILKASIPTLRRVPGIGPKVAASITGSRDETLDRAHAEFAAAERIGARLIAKGSPDYPPLLAEMDDSPAVFSIRGRIDPHDLDRFPVGMVGSRSCTLYGLEQAERFAGALARAGLTVVSGGARGIDTASHRGALNAGGRTIVVQGCGLAHAYPPDNAELFERIIAEDRGAIISELPINTAPKAENFPARNRIISALSLGVLVIEAGRKSGALITARLAAEEHGREVMALPGRVDSDASRGTLELIRDGGAAPVIEPADVVHTLENAARHHFDGTHTARFVDPLKPVETEVSPVSNLGPTQQRIIESLTEPRSADDLAAALGLELSVLRSELTMLELQRRIVRKGSFFTRHRP